MRSTEGWLGVDDPVLREEQETLEAFGCCEFLKRAMELQLALEQKLLAFGRELATEDALRTRTGRKKREETATIWSRRGRDHRPAPRIGHGDDAAVSVPRYAAR